MLSWVYYGFALNDVHTKWSSGGLFELNLQKYVNVDEMNQKWNCSFVMREVLWSSKWGWDWEKRERLTFMLGVYFGVRNVLYKPKRREGGLISWIYNKLYANI